MAKFSEHSFYCMRCGRKGLPIARRDSHNYSKHHRKRLWCPWCGMEVNHIECRNDSEVYEFKQAFEAGEYKEEAEESVEYIKKEKDFMGLIK